MKIIRNKAVYRQAGDLENKILHELSNADPNDCNCIVKKLRSFEFRGHLCLVFELLSLNLYQFLHKNNFVGLSIPLIRRIAIQLFMALKTEEELFGMFVAVIGMPSDEFLQKGKRKHKYVDVRGNLRTSVKPFSNPLVLMLEKFDSSIVDLVQKCLAWEPKNRIVAEDALFHDWIRGQRN